jgi:hypothetical protein
MTLKPIRDETSGDIAWDIVCPKGCQPGGHVSEAYVEAVRAKDGLDRDQVVMNYPELNPDPMSDEEIEAGKEALWG